MKALNYINLGWQRLLSYEVKGGGFEWFGHAPAHNVLTAYGLMEFSDMAKVYDVDKAVITRTRDWLYSGQQPDGSWKPQASGHGGLTDALAGATLRTTAYIAWALAETGEADPRLTRAIDYVSRTVRPTDDPYTLALCANALVAARHSEAKRVVDLLVAAKMTEGKLVHWDSTGTGVTYSRGDSLDVETTALAAYALIRANSHVDDAHAALDWLIAKKDPRGTWYSTQATVAAMRALLAGTDGRTGSVEGNVNVTVTANGQVAKEILITPDTGDVYRLVSLRPLVRKGQNRVAIEAAGKGNLAYQVVATHYVPWTNGAAAPEKEMDINVDYDSTALKKDDMLTCRVTVRYNRPGAANMTIVDLGVPPGFEVVPDGFERLKKDGVIERWSMTGRQVILYFDSIAGGKPVRFSYQLRAKFPVKVKTPPSSVYQYYDPKVRDEAAPVTLTVM
jgi:uncharacterized protein YfaS (alpha-2-macroglobulin family)